MLKRDFQKAQAAVELAVFGAILIFLLGTIVRTALGNSYEQNQNFKAMRKAMLESWEGTIKNSTQPPGDLPPAQNIARNSAQILLVEDRLSPDFIVEDSFSPNNGKYGDLERNPFIFSGSGTVTYNLYYPASKAEQKADLPFMDVYINGQHFPFTMASYVRGQAITKPVSCTFPAGSCAQDQCLRELREWVTWIDRKQYKLFYTHVPNPGDAVIKTLFSTAAPEPCTLGPNRCKDKVLSDNLPLLDYNANPIPGATNTDGVMQYDLLRNADYAAVLTQFPSPGCEHCMRRYVAWQWAATLGNAAWIGLDPTQNQYPSYDIDSRLKEVTIFGITQSPFGPVVTYEDPDGGDIDSNWDVNNSCNPEFCPPHGDCHAPKPGLQNRAEILTFTSQGTYLLMKEGKLYNPENGQVVRSQNKRDTVDLISRSIQMSNNTGRFCTKETPPRRRCRVDGSEFCLNGVPAENPVEVCLDASTQTNCKDGVNIKQTCYDTTPGFNRIFVRSRIQDRRGRFWMTDVSGQLKVDK